MCQPFTAVSRLILALLLGLAIVCPAHANSPTLQRITPLGGQRGSEVTVQFTGQRLFQAADVLFYRQGIRVKSIRNADPRTVEAVLVIDDDAPVGEHPLRLRTRHGITELATFHVSPYPNLFESDLGSNDDMVTAPLVQPNVTINGVAGNEDIDYYRIEARKGDRISVEVEGMRLGNTLFDSFVAILDSRRFQIAVNDDSTLGVQDPVLSILAPEDGTYVIAVREAAFAGHNNCHYRLHIGHFPRPITTFPLGGQAGQTVEVTFLGDAGGPYVETITLPEDPDTVMWLEPTRDGLTAPTPLPFRVSGFPCVHEAKPNNRRDQATAANRQPPLAFNGIIEQEGEQDFFSFEARRGRTYHIRVHARDMHSPLDSVLNVFNSEGRHLVGNDDSGGPDSYIRFQAPEDGTYILRIRDHLGRGGPDFVYRIEITPTAPQLNLTLPTFRRNTQERQAMDVPQGGRFATIIQVQRQDFGGDITLDARDLPEGVTIHHRPIPGRVDRLPVVFEAAEDAPISGSLVQLLGNFTDARRNVSGAFTQNVPLIYGPPNNTVYYRTQVDRLAVGVTAAVPFSIEVVQPKVPLVQDGRIDLELIVQREEGFTGEVHVQALWLAPGVGSVGTVRVPGDADRATFALNANANAAIGDWPLVLVARANQRGPVWTSSQMGTLTLAEPIVRMRLNMTAVQRGQSTRMVGTLEHVSAFEGEARVTLMGLPHNATAQPLTFKHGDKQVVFEVQTQSDSPVGQHRALFAEVVIDRDGEPITHISARDSVLRIDAPRRTAQQQPRPQPAEPSAEKPAAEAPAPLSRLEQLRQQQEMQASP